MNCNKLSTMNCHCCCRRTQLNFNLRVDIAWLLLWTGNDVFRGTGTCERTKSKHLSLKKTKIDLIRFRKFNYIQPQHIGSIVFIAAEARTGFKRIYSTHTRVPVYSSRLLLFWICAQRQKRTASKRDSKRRHGTSRWYTQIKFTKNETVRQRSTHGRYECVMHPHHTYIYWKIHKKSQFSSFLGATHFLLFKFITSKTYQERWMKLL